MKFCSLTDDLLICMHNVLGVLVCVCVCMCVCVCVCTVSVFGVYNNICVHDGVKKKKGGGG